MDLNAEIKIKQVIPKLGENRQIDIFCFIWSNISDVKLLILKFKYIWYT
jgi:hypothetical protein